LQTGIDQGAAFEVIYGSDFGDVINGNGGQDDSIWGLGGEDYLSVSTGTLGRMRGGDDNDTIIGADMNDRMRGDQGDDIIDGNEGIDTVRYNNSPDGVFVNLSGEQQTRDFNGTPTTVEAAQALDGWGTVDTLYDSSNGDDPLVDGGSQIEDIEASDHNDVLIGSNVDNRFVGFAGDDLIDGLDGDDTVAYNHHSGSLPFLQGVEVDLSAGIAIDNWGNTDTLVSIENVLGSSLSDVITGDANANVLSGGSGNDTFVFTQGFGGDLIDDFKQVGDEDILDFVAFGFADDAEALSFASEVGSDVVFDFGTDGLLTVSNTTLAAFGEDNIIV
jgi:Ca2+-binding RTX toxin-like protein